MFPNCNLCNNLVSELKTNLSINVYFANVSFKLLLSVSSVANIDFVPACNTATRIFCALTTTTPTTTTLWSKGSEAVCQSVITQTQNTSRSPVHFLGHCVRLEFGVSGDLAA